MEAQKETQKHKKNGLQESLQALDDGLKFLKETDLSEEDKLWRENAYLFLV